MERKVQRGARCGHAAPAMMTCDHTFTASSPLTDPFERYRFDLLGYLAQQTGTSVEEILDVLGNALLERLEAQSFEAVHDVAAE
jgi:hypothetical protein